MKRGETKLAFIDRLIDQVWGRIFARQEATYREHHPTTLEFAQFTPAILPEPGTWIYDERRVALGVLSPCKTYVQSKYGRYQIPRRFLLLTARREEANRCPCSDCVAVRERKEMAVLS